MGNHLYQSPFHGSLPPSAGYCPAASRSSPGSTSNSDNSDKRNSRITNSDRDSSSSSDGSHNEDDGMFRRSKHREDREERGLHQQSTLPSRPVPSQAPPPRAPPPSNTPVTADSLRHFQSIVFRPIYSSTDHEFAYSFLQSKYNIDVVDFDLETGALRGSRRGPSPPHMVEYTKPISLSRMERWIEESGNLTGDGCDGWEALFVKDPNKSSIESHKSEADWFLRTVNYYLYCNSGYRGAHPNILSDHTSWVIAPHYYNTLRTQSHEDWEAHAIGRRFVKTPGQEDTLDTRFPHQITKVSDMNLLKEDALLKSELCTILYLANLYAWGIIKWRLPRHIVPITLVSASWRSARLVQGIVNYDTSPPTIEIRKSQILDFSEGVRHPENWRQFVLLLSWLIGEPVEAT